MIILEKVKYKNLLASGKHPIEIELNTHDRTLITGANGSGKTTMIQAICFALFGVSYSGINKPALVNSVNQKDMLVELWFSVGTDKYLIKRGIKPNIFEVYENDKLLPQEAKSLDYQKQIEENILRLNFNAFKQIIVIGKSGFTPFMRLRAGERREIIENILDLRVFSVMNNLLKDKNNVLKEQISANQTKLTAHISELGYAKDNLKFAIETLRKNREKIEKKKEETGAEAEKLTRQIAMVSEMVEKLQKSIPDYVAIEKKKSSIERLSYQVESSLMALHKESDFFIKHDNCPTCNQMIDADFKKNILQKNTVAEHDYLLQQEGFHENLSKINEVLQNIKQKQRKVDELKSAKLVAESKLRSLQKQEIEETVISSDEIEALSKRLVEISKNKDLSESEKDELHKKKEMFLLSSSLLSDSGVKTKIISTYIPLINKFINQYLDLMNFYVQFEIDENFKEVIKSRYRDEFTYENFSEGQKSRIDLALLFTWREIARTKNRINVNLLILDEVFDGSLDSAGLDDLNKILKALGNTNVFVISHKQEIVESFPNQLEFELQKNFSVMTRKKV